MSTGTNNPNGAVTVTAQRTVTVNPDRNRESNVNVWGTPPQTRVTNRQRGGRGGMCGVQVTNWNKP